MVCSLSGNIQMFGIPAAGGETMTSSESESEGDARTHTCHGQRTEVRLKSACKKPKTLSCLLKVLSNICQEMGRSNFKKCTKRDTTPPTTCTPFSNAVSRKMSNINLSKLVQQAREAKPIGHAYCLSSLGSTVHSFQLN